MTTVNRPLAERVSVPLAEIQSIIETLAIAVKAADLYLTSYDTSKPSRIKAETRALVEEAMGLIRPQ